MCVFTHRPPEHSCSSGSEEAGRRGRRRRRTSRIPPGFERQKHSVPEKRRKVNNPRPSWSRTSPNQDGSRLTRPCHAVPQGRASPRIRRCLRPCGSTQSLRSSQTLVVHLQPRRGCGFVESTRVERRQRATRTTRVQKDRRLFSL